MKKMTRFMTVVIAAIFTIAAANNFAMSSPSNFKYAVVDVQQVVAASKQVKALKEQQNAKSRELSQFIQNAQKQIKAESDEKKKQALETKLNKEFSSKKAAFDKEYVTKLQEIDKNISKVISQKATQNGYDLVLAKGVVLYSSGTDITDEVIKAVK